MTGVDNAVGPLGGYTQSNRLIELAMQAAIHPVTSMIRVDWAILVYCLTLDDPYRGFTIHAALLPWLRQQLLFSVCTLLQPAD